MIIGALAMAAGAQAQTPDTLGPLLEGLGRGEAAPAMRALQRTEDADIATVLRAAMSASRLAAGAASDPALQRLVEHLDPAIRRAALGVITGASFADGDYAEAERAGRLLAEAFAANGDHEEAAGAEQTWRLAALLAGYPPQGVEGAVTPGSTAARRDKVGLPRIDVSANGMLQEAVFDTGANLSVLSADTARRLGVTVRESQAQVGNGVDGTVPVRVGIMDRLEIAGTTLTNVAFLIIDDAQLTFPVPGGYEIKAIIGLPALRPLGRIRWEQAGRFSVLPRATAPASDGAKLRASGNDLFVDVAINGRTVPLHFDTGASRTALSGRYAAAFPKAIVGLEISTTRAASAGSVRSQQTTTWPDAPIALAGQVLTLPQLSLAQAEDPLPRFYGTLGSDVLQRFPSYTIDFDAMRLELGSRPGSQQ